MSMRDKYQRTLEHILSIPKDSNGLFCIDYKESSDVLGLTVNTFHRHLKKLLSWGSVTIVYKGGSPIPNVCKEIIMDTDRYNDGLWQPKRNPNNFLKTFYSTHSISQYDRDIAILRNVLGWPERNIRHYQGWSNAKSLDYIVNPYGLSETTTKLLSQFVKYIVKSRFNYDNEEYDGYMDCFESLENAHGLSM